MRRSIVIVLSSALMMVSGLAFAGGAAAPVSTHELKQAFSATGKATLVFFQNPYGGPCKMQKEVLDKLHSDRKGNFNIVAVSTTKQEDQRAFYDYGIRSLPSLVLVDMSGKIARVFAPGIQSAETLTSALNKLK